MQYVAHNIIALSHGNIPGLVEAIRAAGHDIESNGGAVYATDGPAVQAIIDAYDARPVALATKLAALADFRWQKEIGGIVINGMIIETTDRSKTLVTGALMLAQSNPAATFQFKTTDNQYVEVDAAGMVAIYQAIGAHVQSCFAKEQVVAAQIAALATWQEIEVFDIAQAWVAGG